MISRAVIFLRRSLVSARFARHIASRKIGPDVGFRQPGQVGNEAAVTNRLRVGTRSSTLSSYL